jgi:hypothetical protein
LERQLNKVDFPTFGRPTIPHFKAINNLVIIPIRLFWPVGWFK